MYLIYMDLLPFYLLNVNQVWISYAQFELASSTADIDNVALARRVYERGNIALRNLGHNEERVLLLEAWRDMELKHGDNTTIQKLESKMPRRVKKRRVKKLGFKWRQKVTAQDGVSVLRLLLRC